MRSLFGHIVLKFTSEAENLATESLYYILSNSIAAREAFHSYLKIVNPLSGELYFRTQVYDEDKAIPDLVGFDDENDQICIIESKFWAGLTENQPLSYFKRFNPSKPSILLFLTPKKRIDSIWSELKGKFNQAGIQITEYAKKSHIIYGKLNNNHVLCVTDWISVLKVIETELDAVGDYQIKSDLLQLRGLCEQMDEKAFLPIDPEEISPMIAKRNVQFVELVDNVLSYGSSIGIFNLANYRSSIGSYHYGRYFRIDEYRFNFKFDNKLWSEYRNNPFWLEVWGKGFSDAKKERPKVKKALSQLEFDDHGIFYDKKYNYANIPLNIEFGKEKQEVVKSMVEQINKIYLLLDKNYEK